MKWKRESKKYLYNYKEGESPSERLRNRIASFSFIVSILSSGKRTENTEYLIQQTNEQLEDINKILSDIETDLENVCE